MRGQGPELAVGRGVPSGWGLHGGRWTVLEESEIAQGKSNAQFWSGTWQQYNPF